MTNLECSKCNDMVTIDAQSVVLPFVCKWCREGFHPETRDQQDQSETCDRDVSMEYVLGIEPPPATTQFDLDTEMIEDLEKQLSNAYDEILLRRQQVDYWKNQYKRVYGEFCKKEEELFVENKKTWWERLWS